MDYAIIFFCDLLIYSLIVNRCKFTCMYAHIFFIQMNKYDNIIHVVFFGFFCLFLSLFLFWASSVFSPSFLFLAWFLPTSIYINNLVYVASYTFLQNHIFIYKLLNTVYFKIPILFVYLHASKLLRAALPYVEAARHRWLLSTGRRTWLKMRWLLIKIGLSILNPGFLLVSHNSMSITSNKQLTIFSGEDCDSKVQR